MGRKGLLSLTMALALGACAIPEPPPGGPEDRRAPKVTETSPPAGSAGAPRNAEIRISFDENMRRARLERLVTVQPSASFRKVRWDKNTIVLMPEEPLHPDTTYLVELKPGFSDAHGVRSVDAFRFAFATSAKIDSGAIAGRVFFRRKPSEKAVVRLFVLPTDTSFSAAAARPARETTTNPDGAYRFEYLPTDDKRFLLWAFQDANGNLAYERDGEAAAQLPDSILLSGLWPESGDNDIFIVDPKEPAEITGRIINSTGIDTFPVTVTLHELSDSTLPTHLVRCDPEGNYTLDRALKGRYTLQGFMDFRADSLCGAYPCAGDSTRSCVEPCVQYPDTLDVTPGARLKLDDLVLEPARSTEE